MCGKYKTVYCVPFQSFKLFTLECRQILIPYSNMKSKSSHIPQQIFFHARCEFDTLSSVFSGFVAKWRLRSTSVFRGKWSVPCLTLVCFKVDTSFMQWQKKKQNTKVYQCPDMRSTVWGRTLQTHNSYCILVRQITAAATQETVESNLRTNTHLRLARNPCSH